MTTLAHKAGNDVDIRLSNTELYVLVKWTLGEVIPEVMLRWVWACVIYDV